jgi:osmotically-inducible protein OsmY
MEGEDASFPLSERFMRKLLRSSVLLLSGMLLVGCNSQDNERLSRMARAAAAKLDTASGDTGLAGLRGNLDDTTLGSRVSARLRWDKAMEGAKVEARSHGGEVELKGSVRDVAQRQKAVEIANTTIGTETVVDGMTMPEPEGEASAVTAR